MSLANSTAPNGLGAGFAACSLILDALGSDKVIYNNTEQYNEGIENAVDEINRLQRPACVVFPKLSEDVQVAMTQIYESEAVYAVQAGGHSMMKDWNNVQDGVLIHFMDMKNVSYSSESDSVTLQPGANFNESLSYLEPYGVAVAGGRVGDVGLGLLLGGGIGYLTSQVGFAAATIRELDVVLTNGTQVTANADNEFADLFKALKGGGNRFGIVTRYEVDAIHTGTNEDKNWYGGYIFYDNSTVDQILQA